MHEVESLFLLYESGLPGFDFSVLLFFLTNITSGSIERHQTRLARQVEPGRKPGESACIGPSHDDAGRQGLARRESTSTTDLALVVGLPWMNLLLHHLKCNPL